MSNDQTHKNDRITGDSRRFPGANAQYAGSTHGIPASSGRKPKDLSGNSRRLLSIETLPSSLSTAAINHYNDHVISGDSRRIMLTITPISNIKGILSDGKEEFRNCLSGDSRQNITYPAFILTAAIRDSVSNADVSSIKTSSKNNDHERPIKQSVC